MAAEFDLMTTTVGIGAKNRQPFVNVTLSHDGSLVALTQTDPNTARRMAMDLLEAAEAAEHDAIVYAELVETVGLGEAAAAGFIAALRDRR